jgi:hypothetical protein
MADIEKRVKDLFSNQDTASNIISLFSVVLIIWAGLYFLFKITTQSRKCSSIKEGKPDKSNTKPIKDDVDLLKIPINKFYIKSAYNCCSLGEYANDYVGTCILSSIISQGVRFLDFEIFSIDNMPVVATSTSNSYNEKETYNSLPFKKVLKILENDAFSAETSPNSEDPLFIHLRIKSGNVNMFSALNGMLLNIERKYIGDVTPSTSVGDLIGKVIIVINNSNKAYFKENPVNQQTPYNMISGNNAPLKMYRYDNIQNISNTHTNNTSLMTLVIPSKEKNPSNIDLNKVIKMKMNMVAMRYQLNDPELEYYNSVFEDNAFILKTSLRIDK